MYRILKLVEPAEIPDWNRRPAKWVDLVKMALEIPKGMTMPVLFEGNKDNFKAADQARNNIRDHVNAEKGEVTVRTRLVRNDDGTATLFITCL